MVLSGGVRLGSYEIIAALGSGGMGEVYRARDTRLNRVVALKTLTAEKISDPERKARFLLEAQAASRLNHPNIVTIYEISEERGICFIAMEYIAGVTLEQLLRGKRLPLKEALKYGMEIADALGAAHSAEIIHRDLKPANVMMTEDGRMKLVDFGLARLIKHGAPEPETATMHSIPGIILGTAPYMSPEQAEGKNLDARSDIFSFGLVLYEMISGQRAFKGDSWMSILAAVLQGEPRPLRDIDSTIPASVELQITRCLRKEPSERFQTMLEVKKAFSGLETPVLGKDEMPSIAVLPFANLSAEKENEYFGDGLAEEIINALTKVPRLKVIARTSAFAFRGKEQDLRAIGQRLNVGVILEGSVRKAGSRIRVTTQLINVADESHLWSERYDREMSDIFAIQDEISLAVADALKLKLVAPRRRTANVDAFQHYLKGLYWYQRYTPESLTRAKDSFEKALVHDPDYAAAHAGLAVFYYGLGALSIKLMTDMAPLAKAAAARALAIDETLSEAHSVLALVAGTVEYDWQSAAQHFQAAMAGEPVPPLVRLRYALYFLTPLGKFMEAIEQYRKALETDPLSMMVQFGLSFAFYCERLYDDAADHAARAVDLYPDYWLVHFAQGLALAKKDRLHEAMASFEITLRLSPSFALATAFLAAHCVRCGEVVRAEKLIREIVERSSQQYVSPACLGIYYAATGNVDKMFALLRDAFDQRDPYLTRIDAEPFFEPFRSDQRYRDLMAGMNLAATPSLLEQAHPPPSVA